ncbi:MAG: hypothetical protein VB959_02225 [Rhodospirillales bacterium]|jgi:hypothetical protein
MSETASSDLKDRIDTIEEAYEYMLAYAAQGLERENESDSGGIRGFLSNAAKALEDIHQVAQERAAALASDADQWNAYLEILKTDAATAQILINFALMQPVLGSELIDNLNATSHVRALLTDVFLLDSALDAHADG